MAGGSGGKRTLTEEERHLWHRVADTARPLDGARRKAGRVDSSEPPAPSLAEIPTARRHGEDHHQAAPHRTPPKPESQPLTGIDRRTGQRLRRGRLEVDERLDLHGMTQVHAHAALRRFLVAAQRRGARTVLVITGKGSPEGARFDTESMWGSGRGILRRHVPEWLAAPDLSHLVSGYTDAHPRHGGGGALYVRIRKGRS